jgi:hypothetical protein
MSTLDLQALHDVQNQLDSLIEEMMNAKLTLAGLAVGGNNIDTYSVIEEEYEN